VQVFAQPSLKTLVRARQEGFCAFSTAAALVSHQALELCSAAVWAGGGQAELFACRRWHSECAAGRGRRRVGCNAGRLHVYSRIGEGVLAFRKQAGLAVCVCVRDADAVCVVVPVRGAARQQLSNCLPHRLLSLLLRLPKPNLCPSVLRNLHLLFCVGGVLLKIQTASHVLTRPPLGTTQPMCYTVMALIDAG
jgi:hypothetical protein